jgi:RNA polymerase sigma-70 factor, ECF subfamily
MPEPVLSPQREGDRPTSSDYEQVYLAEYDHIARTVYLVVRDAARAEDLTQEAFVRLYLRWGKVGRYERPGAWVRRVAIRLATREAHRERVRSLLERQARAPVMANDPDADLMHAVGALPLRQRAAVVLFYFEDLPVAEVADTLGMSESAVKVTLHRARQALAARLGEEASDVR